MKRCPTCNKTFTDRQLTFCVDDGTPLADVDTPVDETTVVTPWARENETGETEEAGASGGSGEGNVPPYRPPGSYIPPGASDQSRRKTWPWVLGILALVLVVFAGLGIAAVILIPKMMRGSENANARNSNVNVANVNVSKVANSNRNSNSANANSSAAATEGNENSDATTEDTTPPPTDEQAVLSGLKDLEDEWTVANINADKKQLNRILADDYVDTSEGKSRGKAEYLKTAQRDTAIQKWEFGELQVSLKGDRATLRGTVRFEIKDRDGQDQQFPFTFTDKFVWRDGRWQATGSEVKPLKE